MGVGIALGHDLHLGLVSLEHREVPGCGIRSTTQMKHRP